jgi:hypothetical protein
MGARAALVQAAAEFERQSTLHDILQRARKRIEVLKGDKQMAWTVLVLIVAPILYFCVSSWCRTKEDGEDLP